MTMDRFTLKIDGLGIRPESVRARDLAQTLILIERSVLGNLGLADEDAVDQANASRLFVSLTEIGEGSDCLTLAATTSEVASSVAEITRAIAESNYEELDLGVHRILFELSRFAINKGWSLEFGEDPSLGIRPARIAEGQEVPDPDEQIATGTTTIYGRCENVGGVKPRAVVRLTTTGERLSVSVSEANAQKLAGRLYKEVGIEGQAALNRRDWQIVRFKATRILDYNPDTLGQAFEELARAANGRWDEVDADDYVRVLRSEDDE